MKNIVLVSILFITQLCAFDQSSVQLIQVSDKNNELVSGAKVELIGTGKVYYTNSKGECYIPMNIYRQSKSVKIECISYKSAHLQINEVSSKIILETR